MKELTAIIYSVIRHPDGSLTYKPITTTKKLTVPLIAKMEGVAKQIIYNEVALGNLKARRIAKCIRVDLEDYLSWTEANRTREYEPGDGARTLFEQSRASRN